MPRDIKLDDLIMHWNRFNTYAKSQIQSLISELSEINGNAAQDIDVLSTFASEVDLLYFDLLRLVISSHSLISVCKLADDIRVALQPSTETNTRPGAGLPNKGGTES